MRHYANSLKQQGLLISCSSPYNKFKILIKYNFIKILLKYKLQSTKLQLVILKYKLQSQQLKRISIGSECIF
jgi:hypothetical protein